MPGKSLTWRTNQISLSPCSQPVNTCQASTPESHAHLYLHAPAHLGASPSPGRLRGAYMSSSSIREITSNHNSPQASCLLLAVQQARAQPTESATPTMNDVPPLLSQILARSQSVSTLATGSACPQVTSQRQAVKQAEDYSTWQAGHQPSGGRGLHCRSNVRC